MSRGPKPLGDRAMTAAERQAMEGGAEEGRRAAREVIRDYA
jgi:hypothetical protein